MQRRGLVGGRLGNHHENQLGAVLVAVDYRRRVFDLCRDEGDGSWDIGGAAVAVNADGLSELETAHQTFGDEKADLDILTRQNLYDRIARSNPFALAIKRVEDQAVARGGDFLLLQLPCGLLECSAVGVDELRLGLDLLTAARQFR